jgi:hypothetical protein
MRRSRYDYLITRMWESSSSVASRRRFRTRLARGNPLQSFPFVVDRPFGVALHLSGNRHGQGLFGLPDPWMTSGRDVWVTENLWRKDEAVWSAPTIKWRCVRRHVDFSVRAEERGRHKQRALRFGDLRSHNTACSARDLHWALPPRIRLKMDEP